MGGLRSGAVEDGFAAGDHTSDRNEKTMYMLYMFADSGLMRDSIRIGVSRAEAANGSKAPVNADSAWTGASSIGIYTSLMV